MAITPRPLGRGADNEPTVRPTPNSGASGVAGEDVRLTTRSASGTVVVACKLPQGVILQLCQAEKTHEPVMGGGQRDVMVYRKVGKKYTIRGTSVAFGQIPQFLLVGRYALTSGIPEDFWEQWREQNKDSDIVERELIFAHRSMEDVEAHCRSNESLLTGLEPLDTSRLPRGIQPAESRA